MNRIIRTVVAAAALAAPTVGAAQFQMPGDIVVTPPDGFDLRCAEADLAPTVVDIRDYGYGGWRWVVVEVTNDGRTDFATEPGRAGVLLSVGDYSAHTYGDITDVPVGASVTTGGWIPLPSYAGPDGEPEFGECRAAATISARMAYDPDLGLGGDPSATDCDHRNNVDRATVPYLQQCPW